MASPDLPSAAVLSALASQVEDLVSRVSSGARASDAPGSEGTSATLYDAERALRTAHRLLLRAAHDLS